MWARFTVGRQHVDVFYIDFSNAFDRVPRQRLLLQLRRYGSNRALLYWIQKFLEDIRKRVLVNGDSSEVLSGIP